MDISFVGQGRQDGVDVLNANQRQNGRRLGVRSKRLSVYVSAVVLQWRRKVNVL